MSEETQLKPIQSQCPKCGLVRRSKGQQWDSDGIIYRFSCSCGHKWGEKVLVFWELKNKSEVRQ